MPCPLCREPIRIGARKCVQCKSDLGWRRFFTVSTPTLAILTALVSVLGSTVPVIKTALEPNNSDLHASYIGPVNAMASNKITLLVNNDGRKTGAVTQATLTIQLPPDPKLGDRLMRIALHLPGGDTPVFIPALSAQPVIFTPDLTISVEGNIRKADVEALLDTTPYEQQLLSRKDVKCWIVIRIANAKGGEKEPFPTVAADCWRVGGIASEAARERLKKYSF